MYQIMIVDDEPNILNSLNRVLKKVEDWDIETYDSAAAALKRAQTTNFELVISDYRMPEMNGIDFLNEIKIIQPEAMRIILSGFSELQVLVAAINEAEIFRYIFKPWNDHDLIYTVKQALEHRDVLVENRRLADQVRQQEEELQSRKTVLEVFAEKHPALVKVEWGSDGSIIVDPDLVDE